MKKILSLFILLPLLFVSHNVKASGYLMDPMPSHDRAPEFSLIGMDEKVHTLKSLEGKFLLVNFWATWCNPCKAEMPTLEAIHNRIDNDKFTVIGIHVGPGPENIRNYLDISPVSFPIFIDMDLEYDWGVPGLPTTFLISPNGEMLYRAVGKRDFSSPEMELFFTKLVNEHFDK
ncbi:MAG: TlpA family protein disulfide reductase [Gammaproteobacteria bacterium]|jgi:thiol-disulfide isomerase/thioredoxin|nr:TlpA family protein disulfide reductase [Gammaproteobacteria bacterium]MBT5643918.1 TlpA family protein disulfide reductase [Gammaproteobacteria bacterium]MBT5863226.1 TlpA family protein disulfide reductase [Gammaproteobacteria bacterium]